MPKILLRYFFLYVKDSQLSLKFESVRSEVVFLGRERDSEKSREK